MSTKTPIGTCLDLRNPARRWNRRPVADRPLGNQASTTGLFSGPICGRLISETEANRLRSRRPRHLGATPLRLISEAPGEKTTTLPTLPTCGPGRRRRSSGRPGRRSTLNSGECPRRTTGTPGANRTAAAIRASTRIAQLTRASNPPTRATTCAAASRAVSTATCGASITSMPAGPTR
jgi:hypothetical protein